MDGRLKAIAIGLSLCVTGGACARSGGGPALAKDPALVQAARDIVALLAAYDCERLPRYLPADGPSFLEASLSGYLTSQDHSAVERVCSVLGVIQRYPRSETMEVRATEESASSAKLVLVDGEREEPLIGTALEWPPAHLDMVNERGAWKLDPSWAAKQVKDQTVRMDLRMAFGGPQPALDLTGAIPDSPAKINGIASLGSPPGLVHWARSQDGSAVCFSALSPSGELFMMRRREENSSATYARGSELPDPCPDEGLEPSW